MGETHLRRLRCNSPTSGDARLNIVNKHLTTLEMVSNHWIQLQNPSPVLRVLTSDAHLHVERS